MQQPVVRVLHVLMHPRRCPLFIAAFLSCLDAQPALSRSVIFKLLSSFRSLRDPRSPLAREGVQDLGRIRVLSASVPWASWAI